MTVSRGKGSYMYGLALGSVTSSVCTGSTFPNRQRLQTVPASVCKYCFWKGSDNDLNSCCYYRPPADSYAAINMGEQEATPVMHAAI